MIIPALNDARDLFNLFLKYDAKVGVPSLFHNVHLNADSLNKVEDSLFSVLSDMRQKAGEKLPRGPKVRIAHLLASREFQKHAIPLALNAYPEKRRLIFIHVPKCAGSNLSKHLRIRYPSLGNQLMSGNWTSSERLFSALRRFVVELHWSDEVYIHGHVTLQRCRDESLIRPEDRVITVLRDPSEIVISGVNYVITGLLTDQAVSRPDTRFWLETLGIPNLDPMSSKDDLLRLAKQILHDTPLAHSDQICKSLGRDDAVSSLENLVGCNVEITTLKHYNTWLETRWDIRSDQRVNVSKRILTPEMLDGEDRDRIRRLTIEDRKVFDLVAAQLDQSGQCFIMGAQLPTALSTAA